MLLRNGFILLLCLPNLGQAFYQWQDNGAEIELRGFFSGLALGINNPNDALLFADDKLITAGLNGRLMLDVQRSSLSFEMHAVQTIIDDKLATGGGQTPVLQGVERSGALSSQFANEHAELAIDRLNVQYSTDKMNIKVGRQPINLAATYYFTPNDFFAPFAAQTFFRHYKLGVDAVRLDWQLDDLSQVSFISVVNYKDEIDHWSRAPDWSETAYLARLSTLFDTFELTGLIAKINGDEIIGLDFQGELFDWLGVRGEGHIRFPDDRRQSRDIKFSLGLEHRWENSLTLRIEQFYHRLAATDIEDYSASTLIETNSFYLARNYTALGASYEVTPLLLTDAVWLINNHDDSSLLALYATSSLSDEAELSIGLSISMGKQPDKGVLKSEFASYPDSFNIEYRLYF